MINPTPLRKSRGRNQPNTPAPVILWSTIGRVIALTLAALVIAIGSWAFFEFVVWSKLPSEIVGKWVVVGGPQDGATFDFFRNGSMVAIVNVDGKQGTINATAQLEGKKLTWTTRSESGKVDTRTQVVRTLTATELVIEDEQGRALKMERDDGSSGNGR